jgi:PPOX class probable F420-dependent enzyme
MRLDDEVCWDVLRRSRHGVLGTVHPDRGVDAVPVVFVVEGRQIVLPIDTVKPKVAGATLQRVRNLDADPRAVLLVDGYDDDWSRLWWVRAHGRADQAEPTPAQLDQLSSAFPAYREGGSVTSVIRVAVDDLTGWSAAG